MPSATAQDVEELWKHYASSLSNKDKSKLALHKLRAALNPSTNRSYVKDVLKILDLASSRVMAADGWTKLFILYNLLVKKPLDVAITEPVSILILKLGKDRTTEWRKYKIIFISKTKIFPWPPVGDEVACATSLLGEFLYPYKLVVVRKGFLGIGKKTVEELKTADEMFEEIGGRKREHLAKK